MSVHSALEALERQVEELARAAAGPPGGGDPPPGESGEAVLRLGVLVERLSAVRAVWSDQFEAGPEWAADGARTGAAWVAARALEHPSAARGRAHAGRDMRALPLMAAAVLRGEARLGHVRLLATAARAKPHRLAALAAIEELGTRTAAQMSEPQFARFVDRWAALVDAEHDAVLRAEGVDVPVIDHADAERAERRELFLSRYGTDGMWALSGTLDTETGLALSAALESVCEAIRTDGSDRSLAQLRHDALAALISGELSAGLPIHKGVRPHLMIITSQGSPVPGRRDSGRPTVSAPGLGAPGLGAPSDSELLDRGDGTQGVLWLSGHARQRLGCDAITQTLTVDGDGVPLRLGRTARVVPPALRRVIDIRDRHCTFAGCTTPAVWCQAHHLVHWEDGGPTDERNLALTCQFHHKAIHERGFDLRWAPDGSHLQTLRPDRTVISVRAGRHPRRL